MTTLKQIWDFITSHGTKLIGFGQVTLGALAIADQQMIAAAFGQNGLRWIILGSGVLTAWRGFYNSAQAKPNANAP